MAKQSQKSEQITQSLSLICDYDQPMTKMEEFESAFRNALGYIEVIKYGRERIHPIKYTNNNHDTYFLTASITWLSGPHLPFKKRMQLKDWYQDFYDEYVHKENTDVRIVGVYRYNGMHIFVDFKIEDYIRNKCNNSSAHVYSNDLYQALKYDYFTKTDQKGNTITTIHSKNFKKYIDGDLKENTILDLFSEFNNCCPFGEWITAKDAICEMKSNEFPKWEEAEWGGFYLEYLVSKFIENGYYQDIMKYINNKKKGEFDFDLYFEKDDYYGDLKASDINQREIQGNDIRSVYKVIEDYGKLWYIVYEHDTKKDKNYNNEMAIFWMKARGKYREGGKISYKTRMKHSVNFQKMVVLEINDINKHLLKVYNQGQNSNGKPRKPKIKILKRDYDQFAIYSYIPENI